MGRDKHYTLRAGTACGEKVSLAYRALRIEDVTCAPCLRFAWDEAERALVKAGGVDSETVRALREQLKRVGTALAWAEAREWAETAMPGGCSGRPVSRTLRFYKKAKGDR